jgi:GNAT superfamily N-acetyltransferase
MEFKIIRKNEDFAGDFTRNKYVDFLFENLKPFGDPREDIEKSIDYAFSDAEGKGGFIVAGFDEGELVSELVMNNTGHKGYIPENILVYVATKSGKRGKGYGKKIIEKSLEVSGTDVALHVEYENPAKRLYERLGFNSKYAEMRFIKSEK